MYSCSGNNNVIVFLEAIINGINNSCGDVAMAVNLDLVQFNGI